MFIPEGTLYNGESLRAWVEDQKVMYGLASSRELSELTYPESLRVAKLEATGFDSVLGKLGSFGGGSASAKAAAAAAADAVATPTPIQPETFNETPSPSSPMAAPKRRPSEQGATAADVVNDDEDEDEDARDDARSLWDDMYAAAQGFMAVHGHLSVPPAHAAGLADWIMEQKRRLDPNSALYKTLDSEQVYKLRALGLGPQRLASTE